MSEKKGKKVFMIGLFQKRVRNESCFFSLVKACLSNQSTMAFHGESRVAALHHFEAETTVGTTLCISLTSLPDTT